MVDGDSHGASGIAKVPRIVERKRTSKECERAQDRGSKSIATTRGGTPQKNESKLKIVCDVSK